MYLPTDHAQRVQSRIEPSSVSPVNVDSHTLSNESLSARAPQAPCRSADECRAARDAKVHQFTTFSYMELFHLPRAQLKSRLGKQQSRHFCRMGHAGIMSARELKTAPVGPGPSIGRAGCRHRAGGGGGVKDR